MNYPWSNHNPYPDGFPFSEVSGLGHENDWGSLPIPDEEYDDAKTTKFVIDFLEHGVDETDRPFFLACGLFRPHLPWYVPKRFFDLYPIDQIALPAVRHDDRKDLPSEGLEFAKARQDDYKTIRDAKKWRHAVQAYLASISCADANIGRVLDALDSSRHAKNTIIVLWSDHGWHLGEKQHWHKSTLWEEATRVPFIICSPNHEPGKCHHPVSLIDLFPTLNKLTRLPEIASHDGLSLTPLLKDPSIKWERPAVIEFKRGNVAVRSNRFRYIRYKDGGEELYDHDTDSNEWTNLAKSPEHGVIRDELSNWITKNWAESAPTKKAFDFDHSRFEWRNRETGKRISGRDNSLSEIAE